MLCILQIIVSSFGASGWQIYLLSIFLSCKKLKKMVYPQYSSVSKNRICIVWLWENWLEHDHARCRLKFEKIRGVCVRDDTAFPMWDQHISHMSVISSARLCALEMLFRVTHTHTHSSDFQNFMSQVKPVMSTLWMRLLWQWQRDSFVVGSEWHCCDPGLSQRSDSRLPILPVTSIRT